MEKETVQVIDVIENILGKETALQELVDHLEEQCKTNPNYTNLLGACKAKLKLTSTEEVLALVETANEKQITVILKGLRELFPNHKPYNVLSEIDSLTTNYRKPTGACD